VAAVADVAGAEGQAAREVAAVAQASRSLP
jgi:hypothetical protein